MLPTGPILLGCPAAGQKVKESVALWQKLPRRTDEEQVQKDVDRAFVYYPSRM